MSVDPVLGGQGDDGGDGGDGRVSPAPVVLFVCVRNAGKSQMAAALLRHLAAQSGRPVEVHSAGTAPGAAVNAESDAALREIGAGLAGQAPKPIDPALLARADRVVVLGGEAHVPTVPGMRASGVEVWPTVEPALDGIQGLARMRLIRDDIRRRCLGLLTELC